MKRYWLFTFNTTYPLGGMSDFIGSFESINECIEKQKEGEDFDGHIFDSVSQKVVSSFYSDLTITNFSQDLL